VLLTLLAVAPACGEPCATTQVFIDSDPPIEVYQSSFDSTGGSSAAAYQIALDLGLGRLESRMIGNDFGRIEIRASDRYQLEQIDAAFAGPAVIDAVLEVTVVLGNGCGLECAYAMTRIEWRDEAGSVVDYLADTAQQLGVHRFEMTLPVIAIYGEPIRLSALIETQVRGLGANLFGRADVSTRLRFDRVPSGAHVVSCYGYDSMPDTPALPSSWGGVKARYR
jgi:hypothetical protein